MSCGRESTRQPADGSVSAEHRVAEHPHAGDARAQSAVRGARDARSRARRARHFERAEAPAVTASTRVVALSICLLGLGACGDGPADAPPSESGGANRAELEQRLAAAAALTDRLEAVRAVK